MNTYEYNCIHVHTVLICLESWILLNFTRPTQSKTRRVTHFPRLRSLTATSANFTVAFNAMGAEAIEKHLFRSSSDGFQHKHSSIKGAAADLAVSLDISENGMNEQSSPHGFQLGPTSPGMPPILAWARCFVRYVWSTASISLRSCCPSPN